MIVFAREAAPGAELAVLASPSGAPEAFVGGRPASVTLSITHSHGLAAAAIAPIGTRLGFDLERIEPRPEAFIEDWFTPSERAFVAAARAGETPLAATLVWSAKESVMKAVREGLRIAPRDVEALPEPGPADGAWRRFRARGPEREEWSGWWRAEAGFVLSAVADPPSGPPDRIG